MPVETEVCGRRIVMRALVDTGAQTSLVRSGILPNGCFRPAKQPLRLRTASGDSLPGGEREADIRLMFKAHVEGGTGPPKVWSTVVRAHDGGIGCDLILGYPWLRDNRLDVQPWRHTLQLHEEPRWVLTASGPGEDQVEEPKVEEADGLQQDGKDYDSEDEPDDMESMVRKMRVADWRWPEYSERQRSKA